MVGLAGDRVYDVREHGGPDQAVYAYAREDLDFWAAELGRAAAGQGVRREPDDRGRRRQRRADRRALADRAGPDPGGVRPRIPCGTFQGWLAQVGWIKRFTLAAMPGAYFRVIEPGEIQVGDPIEIVHRPDHDVTHRDCRSGR